MHAHRVDKRDNAVNQLQTVFYKYFKTYFFNGSFTRDSSLMINKKSNSIKTWS
jgi:hypothetical protein